MNETLTLALAIIPALIIAIVFHEVAHGWVARMLGDPTAAELNRLSLNPIRHVDPVGTLLVPGGLALVGAPVFGWAKPVPVNRWRLNNPRYGMMAVAAAGPATNFILAAIGAAMLGLFVSNFSGPTADLQSSGAGYTLLALQYFIRINIFLALFNLLPIPPFDGSHIVEGLLPDSAARAYERLRPYGMLLMVALLLVIPMLFPSWGIVERLVLPPVEWMWDRYMTLAGWFAG